MTDTTETRDPSHATVGLRGGWHGEANDPQRSFQGVVTASSLKGLPVGTAVTVTYQDSGRRVTGPGEHGTYVLRAGGESWKATRLTLHASQAGQARDDRMPDGDWEADLVGQRD